jgi:general secretion pathway protein N
MMKGSRSFIAILFSAILVALVSAACVLPARWALLLVPDDGLLSVVDADGTIWSGRAWIALGRPETRRMIADPVQWQLRGLALELRHPWMLGPLTLTPHWSGVEISAQQARLPAAALTALGAPWNTLAPAGRLELNWRALSSNQPQGAGPLFDFAWRDAGSALAPVAPLGDYRLRVASTGQGLTLDLATEKGVLEFTGQGGWNGRIWNFQGQAKASASASETQAAQLSSLLSAIGPLRDGAYRFGTRGR